MGPRFHFSLLLLLFLLPATLTAQWTNLSNAHLRKFETQSVTHNGKLYSITGFNLGLIIQSGMEVYDPATDIWTMLAPMPLSKYETNPDEGGVTHMGVGLVGDSIWVVGGRQGNHPGPITEEVWIYDIGTNIWSAGPDLPLPLAGGGMAVLGRKIFVFGGFTDACNSDQSSFHLTLDVDQWLANPANTWVNERSAMPNPRNHFGTTTMSGKIYAFGGQIGHDCCGSGLPCGVDATFADEYDPLTDTWTRMPNLPYKRSHVEAATYAMDGKLYISSSETGATISNTTMEYNLATGTWSIVNALKLPTGVLAPIVRPIGDQLYLLTGGYGGVGNPTDSAKVLTISRTPVHKLGFSADTLSYFLYQNRSASGTNLFWTVDGEANYTLSISAAPSWLSLQGLTTGTVGQTSRFLAFDMDVTGLTEGDYFATVVVTGSGADVLNPASTISYSPDSFVVKITVGPSADGIIELSATDACDAVEVGSSSSRFVTLYNPGTTPVTISSVALSGASSFQLVGSTPASLSGDATATVEVEFSPLTSGAASTDLIVIHDGVSSPDTLPLACFAVNPCVVPTDWVSTALGTTYVPGSACVSDDVYYLRAAGTNIWSSKDEGHFIGTRVVGDGELVVRINEIERVNNGSKVGLMMRTSLNENSVNAYLNVTPVDGIGFQFRKTTGASTSQTKTNNVTAPRWLRLTRVGDVITAFHSADGLTWTMVNGSANPQTVVLGDTMWVGMAITSQDPTQAANAVADNFSMSFSPSIFPVELISFEGAWAEDQVALRWESASEEAFSHYEVTRLDGSGSFLPLGRVNAAGAGWYQFADLNPLMQRNVYRLSMVDLDGSVAYSPLVEISNPDPAPFLVTVHEADKEILIHWQIDAGEVELRLIDITGRTVMSESVNTSAGLDQTIRVASLPAGWYHLQVISREPIAGKSVILR